MASSKTKDLAPKKNPKGGRLAGNANLTLVRAAKPKQKDLAPKKNPKGGRLVANHSMTLVSTA